MPLDPEFEKLVAGLTEAGMPNAAGMSISEARVEVLGFRTLQDDARPMREVRNILIPCDTGTIQLRAYIPQNAPTPAPAILYFHGGGWVIGGIEVADPNCRDLADAAQAVVVSVEYRLAPEAKFPAPLQDCYAATRWVYDNAAELGVDPTAIAVSGDSAGGNLAACVCLLARDEGGPPIAYQILIYPVCSTGITPSLGPQDGPTAATVPIRGSVQMDWYRDRYLRTDDDLKNPYAVPLAAADLSGLPPALIVSCEYDRLVAENTEYADRLRAAGVPVEHTLYAREMHGFFWMSASTSANYAALLDQITSGFRRALAQR